MGYTHYWTQPRNFTAVEWAKISCDVRDILVEAKRRNIVLGNSFGDAGSTPIFKADHISFNGLGDQGCETFYIERKRTRPYPGGKLGWSFCKTRREPYDAAVTATLTYLASTHGYEIGSDGDYPDWVLGFEIAQAALPQYTLRVPIPLVTEAA